MTIGHCRVFDWQHIEHPADEFLQRLVGIDLLVDQGFFEWPNTEANVSVGTANFAGSVVVAKELAPFPSLHAASAVDMCADEIDLMELPNFCPLVNQLLMLRAFKVKGHL